MNFTYLSNRSFILDARKNYWSIDYIDYLEIYVQKISFGRTQNA